MRRAFPPLTLLFLVSAAVIVAQEPVLVSIPAALRQGDPCVARVSSPLPLSASAEIRFPDGYRKPGIALFPFGGDGSSWTYAFAFAVPMGMRAGDAAIVVSGESFGSKVTGSASFRVEKRAFERERIPLTQGLADLQANPDPAKDEQSLRYLAVLSSVDADAVYLDAPFSGPVPMDRRTSLFGHTRSYVYPSGKTSDSVHAGYDYGISLGSPVLAPGRAIVVLAENRILTGWTAILEHLPGMFTIYMHMDGLEVTVGQVLEKDQVLGHSGATGFATGPHLHWELRIGNVACDPEALLDGPKGNARFGPALRRGPAPTP